MSPTPSTSLPLELDAKSPVLSSRPTLSIVSTMYRSRPFLEQFLALCVEAVHQIGVDDYEIVLVNDGSPDDSLAYARERCRDLDRLVVVDLSRNFGHHPAMQAGLAQARGELIFLIDCDLEVSPLTLADFYASLRESGSDLVFGYQAARKGGALERVSGGLFWKGFNLLSETTIPENTVTERLMTRRFRDALLQLGDRNLFLGGMMSWTGFQQRGIAVGKTQRQGQSTYTLLKRVQLMSTAISSFSAQPLLWLFNCGLVITLLSFSYGAYLVARKLIFGDALMGYTSVMAFMAFSLGVLTTSVGLVGVYVGKIFSQVQNRPTYLLRAIYGGKATPVGADE